MAVSEIAKIVIDEMELIDTKTVFTGGVEGGRGWAGDVKNMWLETSRLRERGWKPKFNSREAVRLAAQALVSKHGMQEQSPATRRR